MGKAREEQRLQTSNLESRIANTLPSGSDHLQQFNKIKWLLCDLSHGVTLLPAAIAHCLLSYPTLTLLLIPPY